MPSYSALDRVPTGTPSLASTLRLVLVLCLSAARQPFMTMVPMFFSRLLWALGLFRASLWLLVQCRTACGRVRWKVLMACRVLVEDTILTLLKGALGWGPRKPSGILRGLREVSRVVNLVCRLMALFTLMTFL